MTPKRKWKFTRKNTPATHGIKVSDDLFSSITSNEDVICLLPEPHYMPDMGDRDWYTSGVEHMKANAQLIVTAVNACIKLNPKDPLAVASSISDLCESLEYIIRELDKAGVIKKNSIFMEMPNKVLAKVKERS